MLDQGLKYFFTMSADFVTWAVQNHPLEALAFVSAYPIYLLGKNRAKNDLLNKHLGFQHASVMHTRYSAVHDGSKDYKQLITTLDDDLDCAAIFNSHLNPRCLQYFERAAQIALDHKNQDVLDHIKTACSERDMANFFRKFPFIGEKIAEFIPRDTSEKRQKYAQDVYEIIIDQLKKKLSSSLANLAEKHWYVYEGSDPNKDFAYLYPSIFATRSSSVTGIKINIFSQADIDADRIPSRDNILPEVGVEKFQKDPAHKHADRPDILRAARDRLLDEDGKRANEVFVRVPMNIDWADKFRKPKTAQVFISRLKGDAPDQPTATPGS